VACEGVWWRRAAEALYTCKECYMSHVGHYSRGRRGTCPPLSSMSFLCGINKFGGSVHGRYDQCDAFLFAVGARHPGARVSCVSPSGVLYVLWCSRCGLWWFVLSSCFPRERGSLDLSNQWNLLLLTVQKLYLTMQNADPVLIKIKRV
jgi:hypothetical protein